MLIRSMLAALGTVAALGGASAQAPASDPALGTLLGTLPRDYAHASGRSASQVYVAGDSITEALLRQAGIAFEEPTKRLICPASTDKKGQTPGKVGYHVRITVAGTGDARTVVMRKGCGFVYHGSEPRLFYEDWTFEVKREGGAWRITRAEQTGIT